MSFRLVPHTPKTSVIKLDKKRRYFVLEQDGRPLAFGLTEEDAKMLLELVNYGITFLVSHPHVSSNIKIV